MEMNQYWEVDTRYDHTPMTHRESQDYFRAIARGLGVQMKWMSGLTIPKNALSYTPQNPSPGYRIDLHTWAIEDGEQAMLFHLACGCKITVKERRDG